MENRSLATKKAIREERKTGKRLTVIKFGKSFVIASPRGKN
jgi:hypothetical protein